MLRDSEIDVIAQLSAELEAMRDEIREGNNNKYREL